MKFHEAKSQAPDPRCSRMGVTWRKQRKLLRSIWEVQMGQLLLNIHTIHVYIYVIIIPSIRWCIWLDHNIIIIPSIRWCIWLDHNISQTSNRYSKFRDIKKTASQRYIMTLVYRCLQSVDSTASSRPTTLYSQDSEFTGSIHTGCRDAVVERSIHPKT